MKGSLDVTKMARELSALLQEVFEDEMMELMRRASDPIAQLSRIADQVTPSLQRNLAHKKTPTPLGLPYAWRAPGALQGCLAHKKPHHP